MYIDIKNEKIIGIYADNKEESISGMEELMKKQQEMIEKFIKKFES